jgi:hypothetical protein
MPGLDGYRTDDDFFEAEEEGLTKLCFPCYACKHRHKDDSEEPCNKCGHNIIALQEKCGRGRDV